MLKIKYSKKSDPVCPVCGKSDQVVPVVYGYPSDETMRQAGRGDIKPGGCVVHLKDDFPTEFIKGCKNPEDSVTIRITDYPWHCKRDNINF